jgi:hypothetical protein
VPELIDAYINAADRMKIEGNSNPPLTSDALRIDGSHNRPTPPRTTAAHRLQNFKRSYEHR